MDKVLRLKTNREKSLLRRHPWVFSGAVSTISNSPETGETVQVLDSRGKFLAWASYSPHSQIRARVWSWSQNEIVDPDFLRGRLARSIEARRSLPYLHPSQALRLVHAESDGLPGLIVDRYAGTLVVQFLSAGAEYWKATLTDLLVEILKPERIYERSDVDVRLLEGLPLNRGPLWGPAIEGPIEIREEAEGLRFRVDVHTGHKTGFYLDQRANRPRVRQLAAGRKVLDCFCYTGGFTLNALLGGAVSVLSVDSSTEALEAARENIELNGLPLDRVNLQQGDVFHTLRRMRDTNQSYDLIILDPPKFAATASQAQRAARGYKDINLLAFKLLRPGGYLVTFSCSGGISEDLFQKIVAGAALDAGLDPQIIERLHQAPDHPVSIHFPEGAYLKGLVLRN
jgi:23S rRNA (cytosine1962-C5)-methyltransferase